MKLKFVYDPAENKPRSDDASATTAPVVPVSMSYGRKVALNTTFNVTEAVETDEMSIYTSSRHTAHQ